MRLLLISNSTNAGEAYLDYPKFNIREFLSDSNVRMFDIHNLAKRINYYSLI